MQSKESGRKSTTESVASKSDGAEWTCHYWEVLNRALSVLGAASLTPRPLGRVPHFTSSE